MSKVKNEMTIAYEDFIKVVSEYQIMSRAKYLSNFVDLFKSVDSDNDGVIDTETISTAFIGYAPFANPKITIAVTSPDVSYIHSSSEYMTLVTRRISRKVTDKYFEMYPID